MERNFEGHLNRAREPAASMVLQSPVLPVSGAPSVGGY
jgi:hypothetical protein